MEYQFGDSHFSVVYRGPDTESRSKESPGNKRKLDDEEAKLQGFLSKITRRSDLNSLLTRVQGAPDKWMIWKGASNTAAKGTVRFFCQVCDFEDFTEVICHFRFLREEDKEYRDMIARVQAGRIPLIACERRIDSSTLAPAVERWIGAPGNLSPRLQGEIIFEGPFVPKDLNRHEVLKRVNGGDISPIETEDGPVTVRRVKNGYELFIDDEDEIIRKYPLSSAKRDESWFKVRSVASSPDLDPCLILSPRELEVLETFSKQSLPLLISGSAGSGKTTLLSLVLGKLSSDVLANPALPQPIFVTYSEELRNNARRRLEAYLTILCGIDSMEAGEFARKVCRTFSEFVDSIIGTEVESDGSKNRAATLASKEWEEFDSWWSTTHSLNFTPRNSLTPEDHFRIMKQFIFGYFPRDREPTQEEKAHSEIRRASSENRLHNYSSADLQETFKIWNEYRFSLHDQPTLAERSLEAIECVRKKPDTWRVHGHVIVDEIQDFSPHDIRLLTEISPPEKILPLIMAGDEMQSIAPSGFTFAGCVDDLQEIARSRSFAIEQPNVFKMNENFRNLPLIAELTTSSQRMALNEYKRREIHTPAVHRANEGRGNVERIVPIADGRLDHSVVDSLGRISIAVVIPCKLESKEDFLNSNEFAESTGTRAGILDSISKEVFLTVERCKGLEYPIVILCGFGKAMSEAHASRNVQWILSALTVAVSRARNRIIFLDAPKYWSDFSQRLANDGHFPITEIEAVTRISVSIDEQIETLESRVRGIALANEDSTVQQSDIDEEVRLLRDEAHALAEVSGPSKSQERRLRAMNRLLSSWCRYIDTKSIESKDWKAFRDFDDRFFERMAKKAVTDRSCSSLVSLFDSKNLQGKTNLEPILLIAACLVATEPAIGRPTPLTVQLLTEHLQHFSGLTRGQWLAQLVSSNMDAEPYFRDLETFLKIPVEDWTPSDLDRTVRDLAEIDPLSPLAAYVDISGSLHDSEATRSKLLKWRSILNSAGDQKFELETLTRLYGLSWVDDEIVRSQLGEVILTSKDPDTNVRLAMKSDGARESARRNLETIFSEIDLAVGTKNVAAKFASIAAVCAVVDHDIETLIHSMKSVEFHIKEYSTTKG